MHALKVAVNFTTGERPGGIAPGGNKLPTHPSWQNVDEGTEIRLVLDGDAERFRDVEGVEIIEGEQAIDDAVAALRKRVAGYMIISEALLGYSLQQKRISLDGLNANTSHEQLLQRLYERGALGIARIEPTKPAKCCELVTMAQRRELDRAREESQGSSEAVGARR